MIKKIKTFYYVCEGEGSERDNKYRELIERYGVDAVEEGMVYLTDRMKNMIIDYYLNFLPISEITVKYKTTQKYLYQEIKRSFMRAGLQFRGKGPFVVMPTGFAEKSAADGLFYIGRWLCPQPLGACQLFMPLHTSSQT